MKAISRSNNKIVMFEHIIWEDATLGQIYVDDQDAYYLCTDNENFVVLSPGSSYLTPGEVYCSLDDAKPVTEDVYLSVP